MFEEAPAGAFSFFVYREVVVDRARPVSALLFSATLWGLSWWPLKYFHAQGIDGAALLLVGYGSVGLMLLPFVWRERARWRRETRYVVLMTVLGGYGNLAFAYAMIFGDVVRAMMLFYLAPVWGVLGGRVVLGEVIDGKRWLGVVLALTGAFLVLGAWNVLAAPPGWVDLLALSAGFTFALNNVLCRAAQQVPLATKGAVIFLGCGLLALPLLAWGGQAWPSVAPAAWGQLVGFGLGGLLLATLATLWGVTRMEAGRAAVILIAELLVAVVSATLIGQEQLTAGELAGGALILTAALLEALRPAESARAA
jgi:drug/metabolite transporter (DMT)-like permease